MYRKRAMKILITVILSFSIIISCSFSCFASKTFFSLDSSDWGIDSEAVFMGHYPDKNPPIASGFISDVYSYEELYDDYYVISNYWNDNYKRITSVEFFMPDFPVENYFPNNVNHIIFKNNDNFYLATGFNTSTAKLINHYDEEYYGFIGSADSIYIYSLTYPYSEWCYYGSFVPNRLSLTSYPFLQSIVWSDCPVYDYVDYDSIYESASTYDVFNKLFSFSLNRTLSVTQGVLWNEIDNQISSKLSFQDVSFLFERFGYIIGTSSSFVLFDVDMSIYLNKELIGTSDVFEYCFDGSLNDSWLEPGQAYINSYDCRMDFSNTDIGDNDLYFFITFEFVSDGYNLVFPGDFSIVSASELETEKQHQNIINSLNAISKNITGSVDSAASQITGSVNSAASQITGSVDAVNSSLVYIMTGDVEIAQPDMDTAELDDLVSEQDEIIGNILSSLDDEISGFVPAGYSSYSEYLIDNINSFKSDEYYSAFQFIRSTFDNLVASLSILPLLLFSLTFGFSVFALGRRLR